MPIAQRILLATFLLLSVANPTFSQSYYEGLNPEKRLTQYIIDSWTTDKGLPNNSILDIVRTKDGYMWIATYSGLVRFDGISFEEFPELRAMNGINSLHEDINGGLWISSNDGKLAKMEAGKFLFFDINTSLGDAVITDIAENADGTLWFGTRSGLAKMGKTGLEFIAHEMLTGAIIYCLETDIFNNVWIGTSGQGLFKYSNDKFIQITESEGLAHNSIRTLHADRIGNLWVGTEGGVTLLESKGVSRSYTVKDGLPHNYVNTILSDSRGTLWFGTDEGLVRKLGEKLEVLDQHTGMTDNTIQTLFEGESGVMWVGTYYGGLNRLKDGKFVNYGQPEGLIDEVVNVVQPDGDKTWVGTNNGLCYLKDGVVNSISLGEGLDINKIRDIHLGTSGNVWIGTSEGLIKYNSGIQEIISTKNGLTNDRVRQIVQDQSGNLWLGTAKGLNKYHPKTKVLENYGTENGLENEFILSVFLSTKGDIWVGTNGGGVFRLDGDRFVGFSKRHGLGSNVVFGITEDNQGNIWAASNAGLARLDGEKFQNISIEQGIATNTIFQILIKDGYFWLLTDRGLIRVPRDQMMELLEGRRAKIDQQKIFNKSEGMRTNQVTGVSTSAISENGEILVATLRGLSILNPNRLVVKENEIDVKITSVVSDGFELDTTSNVLFAAGTRNHEFHYTGINFYAPNKLKFRYRLNGFDDKWIDAGNRRVAYFNYLPPGSYTFEVIASKGDGSWNLDPITLGFVQAAYFYETTWFYVLITLFVIIITFSAYYARLRLLRVRNKELSALVKERTVDIENQNKQLEKLNHIKDKLFSLISHDLRGPINSCSSLLDLMNAGDISDDEFKSLCNVLSLQIGDVRELLNDLLDWSKSQLEGLKAKPEKISLRAIVFENFKLLEVQASQKQLTLKNQLETSLYAYADVNMSKIIVRNLISNAIKFSNKGGIIEVTGKEVNNQYEFSIKDTGVGIKPEDLSKIFDKQLHTTIGTSNEKGTGLGLMLVREFVQRNNGVVHVESTLDKGSTFTFTLPLAP